MRALLAVLLLLLPALAFAQGPAARGEATLVADSVVVAADGRLVASGNVQAFYDGTTLSAASIAYDRGADRLAIEGPILIRDAEGNILVAERAELDPRLENGILRGARLVLDRQLQLAAGRIDRVGGNLTALTNAAATSCQVCAGRAPLWEIRADRVVHDEAEGQLYFDDATFRIRGVPVFWLPALRLPDPGNERSSGLLVPRVRTTDQLGLGIRLPVFVELGGSRDLTLTPYLSAHTRTLEARYRQAFLAGDLLVRGAASRDDLGAPGGRGFLALDGALDIGGGVELAFAGRLVSDDAYLLDYGHSDDDRLESTMALTRVGPASLFEADVTRYQSLRDDEVQGALPPVTTRLSWEGRFATFGGRLTLGAGADGFRRTVDGGRDVARVGAFAGWRRDRVLGPGVVAEAEGRLDLDAYRIADDAGFPASLGRVTPAAAVTLRWPLARRGAMGAADLIEPVASLGWSAALGERPPNEDSRLVEFDAANLLALSRLPGEDGEEEGPRLSYGVSWTRSGARFASTLALGQVLRTDPSGASEASGLAGRASDVLLAGRLDLAGGFALNARTLLAGGPAFGKSEARLDWRNARVGLAAAYLYLPADEDENRGRRAAEWTFDAEWRPSERWTFGAGARYDVARDAPARARLSAAWRNECVEVDVSVSRRYTSFDTAEPSTDLGLTVNLNGFSAGRAATVAPGACRP